MKSAILFSLRKLLLLIPFLIGITLLSFILGIIAPGDPAIVVLTMDGITEPTTAELTAMRNAMGLDQPYWMQYGKWLLHAVSGDLGNSYVTGKPVLGELMRRLPVTASLAVCAMGWVVVFGIPLGIWSAKNTNRGPELVLRIFSLLLISVPGFWLAIILMLVFTEELRLLPSSGYGSAVQMIMPSFVLASGTMASVLRLQKTTVTETMQKPFVLTGQAKGLPLNHIMWKHVFPNSVMPVITMMGTFFGSVLGGSVIIEDLFSIPGLGSYVLSAIWSRDYPVIQGYVIVSGTIFVVFNYLVDLSYYALNPSVRQEEES